MIIWNDWKANGTLRADLDTEHAEILDSKRIYTYTKPMYGLTAIDGQKQPIHAEGRDNGTKCSECQASEFCIPIAVEGEIGIKKSRSPHTFTKSKFRISLICLFVVVKNTIPSVKKFYENSGLSFCENM